MKKSFTLYALKPQYSEQVCRTLFVHYIKCNMLSESSKWEMGFVHYIAKFTITRFVISKFEFTPRPLKLLSARANIG